MDYNKDMVGLAKERRILSSTKRDVSTKLIMLLNQLHSCDLKYFPTELDRQARREEFVIEIKKLRRHLPSNLSAMVDIWMADREAWYEAVDTIHAMV